MYYSIAFTISFVAAAVSMVGGAIYLAWDLSFPAVVAAAAIAFAVCAVILRKILRKTVSHEEGTSGLAERKPSKLWAAGLVPFAVLIAVCFIMLFRSASEAAMNTPWKIVPPLFWTALIAAAALGTALLMRAGKTTAGLALLGLLATSLSVAAIVYAIGYGYDPFVHVAAEQHIMEHGFVAPKTPYYAGQYALTVMIARFTGLAIRTIDVWLLPALAALGITGAVGIAAAAARQKAGAWAAGFLCLLPLAPFINTTPFGLACLYCLLSAIVALGAQKEPRVKYAVWIFALASLATHPIAGIPAVALAAIIQFRNKFAAFGIAFLAAAALPALFVLSAGGFSPSWDRIQTLVLPFEIPLTRFRGLGDPLYAIGTLAALAILIASFRRFPHFLAALSAALSGVMVAGFADFSYLPDSEQGWYASRLLMVAIVIAVPAAATSAGRLFERSSGGGWRSLAAITACVFFFVGGTYLAYPRHDRYVISKGWSTSKSDVSAVHAIAADAGSEPYVVLAAQPVSAAALREFGFFRYFNSAEGQLFAYPVPTGGPLYQYYLKMIYDEPSSEYMKQAMELAGVKLGYFVVNSYWTRADHIIGRAKDTSEKWFGIDNADYVFRYTK